MGTTFFSTLVAMVKPLYVFNKQNEETQKTMRLHRYGQFEYLNLYNANFSNKKILNKDEQKQIGINKHTLLSQSLSAANSKNRLLEKGLQGLQ